VSPDSYAAFIEGLTLLSAAGYVVSLHVRAPVNQKRASTPTMEHKMTTKSRPVDVVPVEAGFHTTAGAWAADVLDAARRACAGDGSAVTMWSYARRVEKLIDALPTQLSGGWRPVAMDVCRALPHGLRGARNALAEKIARDASDPAPFVLLTHETAPCARGAACVTAQDTGYDPGALPLALVGLRKVDRVSGFVRLDGSHDFGKYNGTGLVVADSIMVVDGQTHRNGRPAVWFKVYAPQARCHRCR
jgi:hypothetical protein